MNIVRTTLILLMAFLGASLAGCGEKPQVVVYKQGQYQGKADTRPWEAAAFKGDKAAWESAMRQRAQYQNEYQRTH